MAPGGGHDNKAYDPDESGSSMASSPVTSKKEAAVNMEMADLTPPQHPKIMTNSEKMKDFYVSVNEHKKGIRWVFFFELDFDYGLNRRLLHWSQISVKT